MKLKNTLKLVLGLGLAVGMSASGSSLSGTVSAVDGMTTNNITSLGTTDWAYWDTSVSSGASIPTNQKNGGTVISNAAPYGTASLRGTSGSGTETTFSYTNGTSPVSGTVLGPGGFGPSGIFYTGLGSSSIGNGVQLSLKLPTTGIYIIHLWTGAYHATGELTASLPGTSNYVDSTTMDVWGHNPLSTFDYTLKAQADAPGDVLNIVLKTIATDGNTAAHSLISAVSVAPYSPIVKETMSNGSVILSWDGGGTYFVWATSDLTASNSWQTISLGSSPITNAISSQSQMFYKLQLYSY